jgi:hypothetical protein
MMLFSYCVPIRDRAADFKKALPTVLAAARKSPPVEIVVLDYGSSDFLTSYLSPYYAEIRYSFYDAPYFHMAHARNLAMTTGRGDYLISTNADTLLDESYFEVVRELVERTGCDVARAGKKINGVIVVRREEFIKAGGFDERFEFYGPEDSDLMARLERRKLHMEFYNPKLIGQIHTPNKVKSRGYRLPISKWEMAKLMHPIFEQNQAEGKLTANEC